jgi:hypothetical protein
LVTVRCPVPVEPEVWDQVADWLGGEPGVSYSDEGACYEFVVDAVVKHVAIMKATRSSKRATLRTERMCDRPILSWESVEPIQYGL